MSSGSNIKVIVRIRPFLPDELQDQQVGSSMKISPDNQVLEVFQPRQNIHKQFQFDSILPKTTTQDEVFEQSTISEMVDRVVDGYHSTIFAYGQTGSGKTYTMEGYKYYKNDKGVFVPKIDIAEDALGLVQRSTKLIFESIKQVKQTRRISVQVSFLQIYNEKIFDLLNGSMFKKAQASSTQGQGSSMFGNPVETGLKLKWNAFDVYQVENLYTFEVNNYDEVMNLFHFGLKNKVVGSHKMNMTSSRSHTILTLTLESIDAENPDNTIVSKLQLVDLAGSERQSYTAVQGKAQKESIEINKSLFTLRQVVTALTEQSQKGTQMYIPYRDSKLTCLLKQSLGGNSYCCMVACLHPSDKFLEENLSTLQYASKASIISNKPMRNDDPKTKQIEELKSQVVWLQSELGRANQHIQFLSSLTGEKAEVFGMSGGPQLNKKQLFPPLRSGSGIGGNPALNQTVNDFEDSPILFDGPRIKSHRNKSSGKISTYGGGSNKDQMKQSLHFAKESVQMQERIMQYNHQMRVLKTDMFQIQLENDDLRQRLQYMEAITGKDSSLIRDSVSEQSSKVNWAQLLLDDNTDDMIITASREKIAHQIIVLQKENQQLRKSQSSQTLSVKRSSVQPGFHQSVTPMRGGGRSTTKSGAIKLEPMTKPPVSPYIDRKNVQKKTGNSSSRQQNDMIVLDTSSSINHASPANFKLQRYETFKEDNKDQLQKEDISREFQTTSEFFKKDLFTGDKVIMPFPHVTLRKKAAISIQDQDEMRKSMANDPMMQTLQKWREQVQTEGDTD